MVGRLTYHLLECPILQGTNAHAVSRQIPLSVVKGQKYGCWQHAWLWAQEIPSRPVFARCKLPEPSSRPVTRFQCSLTNSHVAFLRDSQVNDVATLPLSWAIESAKSSVSLLTASVVSIEDVIAQKLLQKPETNSLAEVQIDVATGDVHLRMLQDHQVSLVIMAKARSCQHLTRQSPVHVVAQLPRLCVASFPQNQYNTACAAVAPPVLHEASDLPWWLGVLEASMLLGQPLLDSPLRANQLEHLQGDRQAERKDTLHLTALVGRKSQVGIGSASCLRGVMYRILNEPTSTSTLRCIQRSALQVLWQTSSAYCGKFTASGRPPFQTRLSAPSRFTACVLSSLQGIQEYKETPLYFLSSSNHDSPIGCLSGLQKTADLELGMCSANITISPNERSVTGPVCFFGTGNPNYSVEADKHGLHVSSSTVLVPRLAECNLEEPIETASPASVFIITGGLGTIGSLSARWAMEHGGCDCLLVGRTGRVLRGHSLEYHTGRNNSCQGMIEILKGDLGVTEDSAGITGALRHHSPSLLHAGGILADATIAKQTVHRVRSVFAPKLDGAMDLQAHLELRATCRQLLFSSIAALWGSPGQAQYAAANSMLDWMADSCQRAGRSVTSINWGPWSGAGMAIQETQTASRMVRLGIGMIEPCIGVAAVGIFLQGASFSPVVAMNPVDWPLLMSSSHLDRTHIADDIKKGFKAPLARADVLGVAHGGSSNSLEQPAIPDPLADRVTMESMVQQVRLPNWADATCNLHHASSFGPVFRRSAT